MRREKNKLNPFGVLIVTSEVLWTGEPLKIDFNNISNLDKDP